MFCYQILSPLRGKLYEGFVDILIENCDTYIFNLPNMEKITVNKRNKKHMRGLPIGYTKTEEPEEHEKYILSTQKYFDLVKSDIVKSVRDTGYLNQVGSNELEVFLLKISKRTKNLFKEFDCFSEWVYPKAPEDPCFFANGKCVFQCISHENLQYLFSYDRIFTDFFKTNMIKTSKRFCGSIPKLDF